MGILKIKNKRVHLAYDYPIAIQLIENINDMEEWYYVLFWKSINRNQKSNHDLAIEYAEAGVKKNEPYSFYLLGDDNFTERRIEK